MPDIKASLLIPAYNAAKWLPELLADAQNQTLKFSEIIIYDDCSSDDTIDVGRSFGARVLCGSTNRGAGYARNRLIEEAACPWIHFHDSDDRMDSKYLASTTQAISSKDTVVVCAMQSMDTITGKIGNIIAWNGLNNTDDYVSFVIGSQIAMGVGLYPREIVLRLGGFREDVRGAEDYDFHIRLALEGAKFVAVGDVLATIRRFGDESFTERNRGKYLEDFLAVVSDLPPLLNSSQRAVLGVVAADLAWWLYSTEFYSNSVKAQKLAQKLGVHEVCTTSKLMAFYSRLFGFNAAIALREKINRIAVKVKSL